MDWKSFFADVIGHIAWPITIVICVIFLRKEFGRLLLRIDILKYKDAELRFREEIKSAKIIAPEDKIYNTEIDDIDRKKSEQIARISPEYAILSAYISLEKTISDTLNADGCNLNGKTGTNKIHELLKRNLISKDYFDILSKLRHARNVVAHGRNGSLNYADYDDFQRLADLVLMHIHSNARAKNQSWKPE